MILNAHNMVSLVGSEYSKLKVNSFSIEIENELGFLYLYFDLESAWG